MAVSFGSSYGGVFVGFAVETVVAVHLVLAVDVVILFFFFFQAEDGIRDLIVTGVQTCALPISAGTLPGAGTIRFAARSHRRRTHRQGQGPRALCRPPLPRGRRRTGRASARTEIGRASCRERV